MSDPLKQFIENNRDAFDTESPAPQLLNKVKQHVKVNGRQKTLVIKLLPWAAIITGIIVLSLVLLNTVRKSETTILDPVNTSQPEYALYTKQISYLQELIDLKQQQLRQAQKDEPELYRRFTNDINQLDSAYHELKTILTGNPNKEILLEAMLRNLQLQTDLLNRQLLIIREIKQKNKSHEKNSV